MFAFGGSGERRKISLVDTISNCQSADIKFARLLKRYDPSRYDEEVVHYHRNDWLDALDNLWEAVDAIAVRSSDLEHGVLLGWQAKASMVENSLMELSNKISRKVSSVPTPVNQQSADGDGSFRCNDAVQVARKASVDAEVNLKIVQEKAKTLSEEVK